MVTAFLFNGPCDGETMELVERAVKIEICEIQQNDVHVYCIYSVNKLAGAECRIYKFKESYKDD